MDYHGKHVLVCGMARSGQSAARFLKTRGAVVTAQDLKEADKIDWIYHPESEGITLYMGKNPDDIVSRFDCVVISPGIPCDLPFVEKAKALHIPVISEIELAYAYCPCPIIAITGTNGKTTTTTLVGEIMANAGRPVVVAGNIGIPFTDQIPALTPKHVAVAELSSFQLETVRQFRPWISAVLNLTPDHLNRHKTMEQYRAAKERIFMNQRDGDFTVLNYDDPACRQMESLGRTVFFSSKNRLTDGVFLDGNRIRARVFGMDRVIVDVTQTRIMPENALAATAIALSTGMATPEVIAATLVDFKGVAHRIEYVTTVNGVTFFNDSKATNTDSAIKGLETMRGPVVLIGGGYDKQAAFGDWVAAFKGKVKHLIVMGETAEAIMETCRAYGFTQYDRVNSLRDAVTLAFAKASSGDHILLSPACASWDMFDNFEQRGDLFKQFAHELGEAYGR